MVNSRAILIELGLLAPPVHCDTFILVEPPRTHSKESLSLVSAFTRSVFERCLTAHMKNKFTIGPFILTTLCLLLLGFESCVSPSTENNPPLNEQEKNEVVPVPIEGIDNEKGEDQLWTHLLIQDTLLTNVIVFKRQSAHPMFAEYNRKIETKRPNGEKRTFDMTMNVGGRTYINVHLLKEDGKTNVVWLEDRWGDYYLDQDSLKYFEKIGDIDGEQNAFFKAEFKYLFTDTVYIGCIDGQESPLTYVTSKERGKQAIQ